MLGTLKRNKWKWKCQNQKNIWKNWGMFNFNLLGYHAVLSSRVNWKHKNL